MPIPTEPVGSLPRPAKLQAAYADYDAGKITKEELAQQQDAACLDRSGGWKQRALRSSLTASSAYRASPLIPSLTRSGALVLRRTWQLTGNTSLFLPTAIVGNCRVLSAAPFDTKLRVCPERSPGIA